MELPIEKLRLNDSDVLDYYPRNPDYVLLRVYRQLSSTVEMMRTLTREIAYSDSKHLYGEAKTILEKAKDDVKKSKQKGKPDITPLIKTEHAIHDLFLALLSNIGYIHGIEEPKRISDHRDTIGTLNQGYNALGAIIRERFCPWYPFQDPESFGHKKGSDDRKIPLMGYQGRNTGIVRATHIYQVSMDFQDVIRDHERLLNLYLTTNQVPLKERRRFFTLFLLRMKPHIDYMFCERECGLPGFEKKARTILKELRDLSKALFIQRNGIEPTVTGRQGRPMTIPEAKQFFKTIIRNSGKRIIELDEKGIKRCLEEGHFTDDDATHLHQHMERIGRIRGSQIHDRIKRKLAVPGRLRTAIFQGDELTDDPEWLVCSELPLATQYGKGKADLVVFKRNTEVSC
ncbi:MAG: hypothetical protein P1Q69_00065 [Candidatus Thorarchaeota archaeon]|nr:hypothetical protein [Candidatus Thorarchaeota archaeon]